MIKMIATASAVAFVVYSCKQELGQAKDISLEETPMQTVQNMFVVQSKNGIIQMRAEGEVMEKYERDTLSYELFPKGFSVFGYTDDGLLETKIVADNAIHRLYNDGRESWEAYGNVVVTNLIKQEVLETDTLYWDQENETIYSDAYIKIEQEEQITEGVGFSSNQSMTLWEIKNTKGFYTIKEK